MQSPLFPPSHAIRLEGWPRHSLASVTRATALSTQIGEDVLKEIIVTGRSQPLRLFDSSPSTGITTTVVHARQCAIVMDLDECEINAIDWTSDEFHNVQGDHVGNGYIKCTPALFEWARAENVEWVKQHGDKKNRQSPFSHFARCVQRVLDEQQQHRANPVCASGMKRARSEPDQGDADARARVKRIKTTDPAAKQRPEPTHEDLEVQLREELSKKQAAKNNVRNIEEQLKTHRGAMRAKLSPFLAKLLVDTGRLTRMDVRHKWRAHEHEHVIIDLEVDGKRKQYWCANSLSLDWDHNMKLDGIKRTINVSEYKKPPDTSRKMWAKVRKASEGDDHNALGLAIHWCSVHDKNFVDPIKSWYRNETK